MKKIGMVLATCFIIAANLAFAQVFILESRYPLAFNTSGLHASLSGGYEGGSIPDWFASPNLGLSFFGSLRLALGLSIAGFPGNADPRFAGMDLTAQYKLLGKDQYNGLQPYIALRPTFGDPIMVGYDGRLPGVSDVVSPRAEGGTDLVVGLAFSLSDSKARAAARPALGLVGDCNFAFTGWRDSALLPDFAAPGAMYRLYVDLVPGFFLKDRWFLGVQNRLTYWFDRGYIYDLVPEANWSPTKDLTLALGIGIPAIGGNVWKAWAGVSWNGTVPAPILTAMQKAIPKPKPKPATAPKPAPAPKKSDLSVIKEGDNIRIRVYFNFPGDRAELFEPVNTQFGPQNRALIAKVAELIKNYPDYQIIVEGHTNRAKFEMSFDEEQKKEMLPLAKARAEAVMKALVAAGIKASLMKAEAYGGLKPLVKFEDLENCWKNRRVEILLVKPAAPAKTKR